MDEQLKSAITREFNLDDNEIFEANMHSISYHSCSILGMKHVARKEEIPYSFLDERDEYFNGIESIVKTIYPEYKGISLKDISCDEIIKLYTNKSFPYSTNKERFEIIERIRKFLPKLQISWLRLD